MRIHLADLPSPSPRTSLRATVSQPSNYHPTPIIARLPLQVVYRNLTITRRVKARDTAVSSVPATLLSLVTGPCSRAGSVQLRVLDGISGVLKAGTATLVIGAPGSGKSAFLRALTGRLDVDDPTAITYNGLTAAQLRDGVASLPRLTSYCPQQDIHEPMLTVKETLSFAHSTSIAPLPPTATPAEREARGKEVDHVIERLGMGECANTIVGNSQVRGISGGQKRRLTIGETLVSGSRLLALDGE